MRVHRHSPVGTVGSFTTVTLRTPVWTTPKEIFKHLRRAFREVRNLVPGRNVELSSTCNVLLRVEEDENTTYRVHFGGEYSLSNDGLTGEGDMLIAERRTVNKVSDLSPDLLTALEEDSVAAVLQEYFESSGVTVEEVISFNFLFRAFTPGSVAFRGRQEMLF